MEKISIVLHYTKANSAPGGEVINWVDWMPIFTKQGVRKVMKCWGDLVSFECKLIAEDVFEFKVICCPAPL